jgi:hypothetical protein
MHRILTEETRRWKPQVRFRIEKSLQLGQYSPSDCSIYSFILNHANILAEFKTVAEKAVKNGQSFESLLAQYSIPVHLFKEVFPDEYRALAGDCVGNL